MVERPHSRYTRERTWAALYSQHINAGYALVPYSLTNNSIAVIRCKSPEEVQTTMQELFKHAEECAAFYEARQALKQALEKAIKQVLEEEVKLALEKEVRQALEKAPTILEKAREAVVIAKSSDYYHYHLSDHPEFHLVVCGLHDSYLHLPVWEMRTNQRYKPRETALAITSPAFEQKSKTQFGHNILVGALLNGDADAKAFKEQLPPWTQKRLTRKVRELQSMRYQGRPLAFLTDAERRKIGEKISEGLRRYHEQRRLKAF